MSRCICDCAPAFVPVSVMLNRGMAIEPFDSRPAPAVTALAPLGSPEMTSANFYDSVHRHFTAFDVQITEHSTEAYLAAFTCTEAARMKNVVYLFRAERKVPRLVGESDILYIGQTKSSFERRYKQWADVIAKLKRNEHALKGYGPIRLSACDHRVFGQSLLAAENQMLWWYYANHFEYPPFNYTRAKDPSKIKPKAEPQTAPQDAA